MLTQRQVRILKAIVDEFVKTGDPIGSKTLMDKYNLPYSSATIRNDMQALEEKGYLEKTHTSSGRVPSTIGYKFYCENLLDRNMDQQMQVSLRNLFAGKRLSIEDAITESCNLLSQMTNMTSGVLGPDSSGQRLEFIRLFPIDKRKAVCVFITDQGHTENKLFTFDEDVSMEDIQNCCDILNNRLKGTLISEVVEKMELLRPILASQVQRYEMIFSAFVQAFLKFANDNMYVSGRDRMLYQPEFSDIERLRTLMNMLEDSSIWHGNNSPVPRLTAKITKDSELSWFEDVAVVKSNFYIGSNQEHGQLMIVGPSRMDYNRVVSLMEYMGTLLQDMYGGNNGRRD